MIAGSSRAVIADRVALVRRLLGEAGTLPLDDFDDFVRDPRMVAAGESYLRRALEALLDVARHVLAKGFARGPSEYAEVARQLGAVRVVSREQSERLVLMARCRNRLVRGYGEVTARELYDTARAASRRRRRDHDRGDDLDGRASRPCGGGRLRETLDAGHPAPTGNGHPDRVAEED